MSTKRGHLLVSEDDFLASETVEEILGRVPAGGEVLHLSAEGGEIPGIEDALTVPSLFADDRAVVVHQAERLGAAAAERLGGLLQSATAASVVIVVAVSDRQPAQLVKKLGDVLSVQRLSRPRRGELIAWVRGRIKSAGLTYESDVPGLLVEGVGSDLRGLAGAVEQLATRCRAAGRIGRDDVVTLVPRVAEQPPWALYDALCNRDARASFRVLDALLSQGSDVIGVLFAVASQNRLVMRAKSALERTPNLSEPQLAQAIGASVGRAAVVRRQAGRCSWEWLTHVHQLCAQADFDLKGGDEVRIVGLLPADMVMQRLVDSALPALEPSRG